jgi:hypothetical protein
LSFSILGRHIRVACADESIARVVLANYEAALAPPGDAAPAPLDYAIAGGAEHGTFVLLRDGRPAIAATDIGDLLFCLEKDITVALQEARTDLLFLHAAALAHRGMAYLLAGDSGSGKSSTAWGLLHHGFGYLSDELAPVDLRSSTVLAYPHALCLKRPPPSDYPLPANDVLDLGRTLHVPVRLLPGAALSGPCAIAGVLFVHYAAQRRSARLRPIGAAEAAARLYTVTLNALAHPSRGLDAVQLIAERVPCLHLEAADLAGTCDVVRRWVLDQPERAVP